MNTKVEALIFDLDGVIVDTAKYHFRSWQILAGELGFELPGQVNESLKGIGRMESLDIVLSYSEAKFSEERKQHLATFKNNTYLDLIRNMKRDELLPGVLLFIDKSRELGYKLAVASSSKNARTILKALGITSRFDVICDGQDIQQSKPDPEVFLKACTALHTDPKMSIVFEDAVAGILAARAAGSHVIGVGDAALLMEADHVIPGFDNITPQEMISVIHGDHAPA